MKLIKLLAFLFVGFAANQTYAATSCTGVQTPVLCTLDHTLGAFITVPVGAASCKITDGATFIANINGSPTGKVSFAVPTATVPAEVTRTITATCTDAFAVVGAPTRYVGTFPVPAPLGAPAVSSN